MVIQKPTITDFTNATHTHTSVSQGGVINTAFNAVLTLRGSAVVAVNQASFIAPYAGTLSAVYIKVGTAPTGASLIVDVNKNGTTIFTTQANRPTITASNTTATSGTPDVTSISQYDVVTIDVDQVGSTVAGGVDLWIYFTITPS